MKRNELRAMLLEQPYDALVLTSEISRRYATGFHSTAGAVYLSAKQAVFFTDFRYVEAAHAAIKDFAVLAKRYVPHVVMTVVDKVMPEDKIELCRQICKDLGVTLRVRPFEN